MTGSVCERVHHGKGGEVERRVDRCCCARKRAEQAAAELRTRPHCEGEERPEAEQLDIRAGPSERVDGLGELVGDLRRAAAERVRGLPASRTE